MTESHEKWDFLDQSWRNAHISFTSLNNCLYEMVQILCECKQMGVDAALRTCNGLTHRHIGKSAEWSHGRKKRTYHGRQQRGCGCLKFWRTKTQEVQLKATGVCLFSCDILLYMSVHMWGCWPHSSVWALGVGLITVTRPKTWSTYVNICQSTADVCTQV